MKRIGLLTVAFAAAVTLGCNNPRSEFDSVGTSGEASVSAGDRDFVGDLTVAGMAEVELGTLAKERATDSEVKQFADMMVRDHSKAGEELKQAASRHAIPIPAGLDDKH